MTSAQVVETSVTNNSSLQIYSHPDDHTIRTTDTPGFKPFTKSGFRSVHSTMTALLETTYNWSIKTDNDLLMVYIDLKKAFDTVDPD